MTDPKPMPTADDAPVPPLPEAVEARIEHLFRGERRRGRIHPLQALIQRYRAELQALPASTEDAP